MVSIFGVDVDFGHGFVEGVVVGWQVGVRKVDFAADLEGCPGRGFGPAHVTVLPKPIDFPDLIDAVHEEFEQSQFRTDPPFGDESVDVASDITP
jgi:hypothetical protein